MLPSRSASVLGEFVRNNAEIAGDDVALIDGQRRRQTWDETNSRVNALAAGLVELGVGLGDRVAICDENSIEYAETYFALAKLGCVAVPVNQALTIREVEGILSDSRPIAASLVGSDILESPSSEVWRRSGGRVISFDSHMRTDAVSYSGLLTSSHAGEPVADIRSGAELAYLYTSGTTGRPRGCIVTHAMLSSMRNYAAQIAVPRDGPSLIALPLYAGIGFSLVHAYVIMGIPALILPRFNPSRVLCAIEEEGVRHTFLVPAALSALAKEQSSQRANIASLSLIGYGGQTAPAALLEEARQALGCDFYQAFGATEVGGFCTFLQPEEHVDETGHFVAERVRSCGRAAAHVELRIVADDGSPAPNNTRGELAVKSPSNFKGYLNQEEETRAVLRGEWVFTGDIAYKEPDGFYYIVDRKKEIIRSGSMSVSPSEVEAVLMTYPDVASAAVVGVPDDRWGEAVWAAVVPVKDRKLDEEALMKFARARLAKYKLPKIIRIVDSIPTSPTGKVLRRVIRDSFME